MPEFNFISIALAGLVPLIVGFMWYHPKVMGTTLNNEIAGKELTDEEMKHGHHPMVYIMTYVFSFMIAMLITAILSTHAIEDQNLQHGAFHGFGASLFMGIPTFAVIAMFENKSIKYIFIHSIYWMISFIIMGAVIGGM